MNASSRDRSRLHHQHPEDRRVILVGHGSEGSRTRAWRQNGNSDAMRLEFRMQRFTKQQHVSIARSVGCVTGCRLVSEQAGDQKNMSRSAFPHIVCKDVRELCQSKYVQVEHVERFLKRLIDKASIKPKTSVVHQNVDGQPTRIKSGFQFTLAAGFARSNPSTTTFTVWWASDLNRSLRR
jgi:hypothetical protein